MTNNGAYSDLRIAVPQEFEGVFAHFYFAKNESEETITKTLLPSYQTILIFNFGTKAILHASQNVKIAVGRCVVLGPIKRAFNYSLPPLSKILVANFKEDAFYRFFNVASITENLPMNPDELVEDNCFTALWTALNTMDNADTQVAYILEFCKPYLKQRNPVSEQIVNFNELYLNPVKAVAHQRNQSERNIQIHHKKHLGYSAKERNRYQRFLKAIELMQYIAAENSKVDWFEIIDECGYYDQSQLIHDFNHYINLSPSKYLKFQQHICNPTS